MGETQKFKMTWEEITNCEPFTELVFCYNNCYYLIEQYHDGKTKHYWVIEKVGENPPECFGDRTVPIIAKVYEKLEDNNYIKDEKWEDMEQSYYELLSVPCFDGKSFKEIIDKIDFYD